MQQANEPLTGKVRIFEHMVRLVLLLGLLSMHIGLIAQPGDRVLGNFTVQQVHHAIRADFSILGGASCLGAELQRSADGGLTFTPVAAIREVCGGTAFTEHYTFHDETPIAGIELIYRLDLGGVGLTSERTASFIALNDALVAYPNPAEGQLNLRWNALPTERSTVEINDLNGQNRYREPVIGGALRVDVSTLPSGVYLLVVTTEWHIRHVRRVVIR
jgi:hypothetical protein